MPENENSALVAQILSSYFSNNTVAPADLQSVIEIVKAAFGLSATLPSAVEADEPAKLEPVVSVKKSITPDALICLCCGERFKSLKRHLHTEHGLSPEEYRSAFNLKSDYPLVAPNYSAQRSSLAKGAGFGRKPAAPAPTKGARKKPVARKPAAKQTAAE
jgi:predicted transcriptional regulator